MLIHICWSRKAGLHAGLTEKHAHILFTQRIACRADTGRWACSESRDTKCTPPVPRKKCQLNRQKVQGTVLRCFDGPSLTADSLPLYLPACLLSVQKSVLLPYRNLSWGTFKHQPFGDEASYHHVAQIKIISFLTRGYGPISITMQ